ERGIVDVERQIDALVPHAHARGALLQPLGGEERGEILRDAGEDALVLLSTGLALLTLDALPLCEKVAGQLAAREDVRVPPDELLVQTSRDIADIERARLACELRMQRDLKQQIAEFVAQSRQIARVECLECFVCLLEEVWAQALVRLFPIPGTAVRRTEALGDARRRGERREVRIWLERGEQCVSRRERLRCDVSVVRAQQRGIGFRIEDEDDRTQRRK